MNKTRKTVTLYITFIYFADIFTLTIYHDYEVDCHCNNI